MYQEERLYQIMNLLRKKKSLSKQEIMSTFNISRDTARRDIICLVETKNRFTHTWWYHLTYSATSSKLQRTSKFKKLQ